jgi:hypothetical protein
MIRLLTLLLILQLAAVTAVYWPENRGSSDSRASLLSGQSAEVLSIEISDADGRSVQLSRSDSEWLLNSALPANAGKVESLLEALLESDPGYAIANSESAAKRFEVADDSFERRIVLNTAAASHIAYLGNSPGFRKVHARREGDAGVYVLALNSYDAPAEANSWLDKGLLALRNPQKMAINDLNFVLEEDNWVREAGDEDIDEEPVDAGAMETLLSALAGLQVSGIENEEPTGAETVLRITASAAAGDTTLEILEDTEAERYFLRSDHFEPVFATSAYDAERILEAVAKLTSSESSEQE